MTNKWFTTCVLLCDFIHSVLLLKIYGRGLELSFNVTKFSHCVVDERRLQSYFGRTLDECVTACALREHCLTLTYQLEGTISLCELFQSENSRHLTRKGCVYIHKRDITIIQMACGTECKNGKTCNLATGQCEVTECLGLPTVTGGRINGNLHAVGSKLQFMCDSRLRSVDKETVCNPDGEWSVSSTICQRCISPWIELGGTCFSFGDTQITFYDAVKYCSDLGGQLARIENSEENESIRDYISGSEVAWWIALTDEQTEGDWKWYGTNERPIFTDWCPNQPDNYMDKEHCAAVVPTWSWCDSQWNDGPCHSLQKTICKLP